MPVTVDIICYGLRCLFWDSGDPFTAATILERGASLWSMGEVQTLFVRVKVSQIKRMNSTDPTASSPHD
jgi:hypothetical protein